MAKVLNSSNLCHEFPIDLRTAGSDYGLSDSVKNFSSSVSRGIQANRSFQFCVVSDRTVSRDNLAIIRESVLVPMANDHKHDRIVNSCKLSLH